MQHRLTIHLAVSFSAKRRISDYFCADIEEPDPEMFRSAQHDSTIYEMNSG